MFCLRSVVPSKEIQLCCFDCTTCLLSGKLPEEAKKAQLSGQQTESAAEYKPGAESKGEDKSKHKMNEKLSDE